MGTLKGDRGGVILGVGLEFPKIGVPFWGSLCWGPLILGNYHVYLQTRISGKMENEKKDSGT